MTLTSRKTKVLFSFLETFLEISLLVERTLDNGSLLEGASRTVC